MIWEVWNEPNIKQFWKPQPSADDYAKLALAAASAIHAAAPGELVVGPATSRVDFRFVETCLAAGDRWVHLRLCLDCGQVGCCNDSKNRHAMKHAQATGHAVIRSLEPGERWQYCYADDAFYDPA